MSSRNQMSFEMYDRSHRFADVVQARGHGPLRLAVTVDKRIAATETAQLIILAICNILPRISERYTQIDICVPDGKVAIPRVQWQGTLEDYLRAELNAICPWGAFRIVKGLLETYDHCIVVGKTAPFNAKHIVYASASGWRCFVSEIRPVGIPLLTFNPSSCLATAALACMFVYRRAEQIELLIKEPEIDGWSLLNYTESSEDGPGLPAKLDIDEVRQAGVGGTGNALLWGLRYGPTLTGRWIAFEHENADVANWNRYLLLKFVDALRGRAKADIASEVFEKMHPALKFGVMPERVERFYGSFQDAAMVLATVDDPKVRVDLQPHSRNVLLNVGTSSQCLNVSVHDTQKILTGAPCVGCLYGQNEQVDRRQREATVSFVLALAGAALFGEFIKTYAFPEYVLSSPWGPNIFYPASARILSASQAPQCSVCDSLKKLMRSAATASKKLEIHPEIAAKLPDTMIGGS